MSGHSKWANIRVRKTAEDAKRGKIFTRHARLIEMAARSGGGDPVMNSTLRTAVDNARAENVPNANIERAIKKGTGGIQGEQMAETLYAAFLPLRSSEGAKGGGPGGIACLIECLTDNRNRTLASVRAIIGKNGGNFADTNAVAWMFERKGVVVARLPGEAPGPHSLGVVGLAKSGSSFLAVPRTELCSGAVVPRCPEDIELRLIDLGAERVDVDGETVTVATNQSDWTKVRDFLKDKGFEIVEAGLKYVPKERVAVYDAATAQKIETFVEAIEADDDVTEVYTNANAPAY